MSAAGNGPVVEARGLPRAPRRLPLVGHALTLARHPLSFLQSLKGLGDIVRVDIGFRPLYFLNTPELAYGCLVDQSNNFDRGRFGERLRDLVGRGLTASDEPLHRRQRRLMQPAFHREHIAGYADTMYRRAADLAASWRPGQVLDVEREMYGLSLHTVCETLFSTSVDADDIADVYRCLPVVAAGMTSRPLTPRVLDNIPLPAHRRFDEASARLRGLVDRVVSARRAAPPPYEQRDLLALLMTARDADTGDTMDDVQVRDEVVSVLLAGTDALATSLAWALYEIGRNPQIAGAVAREVGSVVGQGPVGLADLPELGCVSRVITETLRLHPMMVFASRRAKVPLEIGGVSFPAGAELMYSPYAAFRDPALFELPALFDPDRWLPERRQDAWRKAFIPFGAGARKCIGEQFAELQITIALSVLLSRISLWPLGTDAVGVIPGVLPRPDGLRMTVRPVPAPGEEPL